MPVCGRFRKSPQAGPCKTAQRSGCRHTHLTESRGEGGGERPFPRLPLISRPMSGIGALITGRPVSGCRGETAPFRVRSTFRFQGRATGPRPVSANVSSPSCPTASFANPDPGPPRPRVRRSASSDACRRRSFRPSSVPQKGRGADGPPSHEGRFADGSSVFRRFQRGGFPKVFPPPARRFGAAHGGPKPSASRSTLRLAAGRLRPASIRRATSRPPPPFRSCDRRRLLRFPPLSAGAVFPGFFLLPPDGSAHDVPKPSDCPSTLRLAAGRLRPASIRRATGRPPPRSGRATADGSPPVHGFRPSCGTDSAAPGGRLLGRRGIRRPPPVSRRVSVILPFRINKRPPPLDKRLRRSYLCRVSVSRAPPASGNQVYLGRPPSTASRAIREIELIPPARTRTSCGRAPQRSVRFFPGLRPRQALPIPALAGCGA